MNKTPENTFPEAEKSHSAPFDTTNRDDECGERDQGNRDAIALPSHVAGSGTLDRLVETARNYAAASAAENTNKAYAADWKHFARWCRLKGADPLPPSAEIIGLYLTNLAAPIAPSPSQSASRPLSVASIDRRLSGLAWNYAQRGYRLDRRDRHIATVLAGIKRKHARPPVQKEAIGPDDILAMISTLLRTAVQN